MSLNIESSMKSVSQEQPKVTLKNLGVFGANPGAAAKQRRAAKFSQSLADGAAETTMLMDKHQQEEEKQAAIKGEAKKEVEAKEQPVTEAQKQAAIKKLVEQCHEEEKKTAELKKEMEEAEKIEQEKRENARVPKESKTPEEIKARDDIANAFRRNLMTPKKN